MKIINRIKFALGLMLCLLLCCSCTGRNVIDEMPYPENDDITTLDYWSCQTLQELYDNSDYVVVGTYQNKAPVAYNMARDLMNPALESQEIYIEGLVYNFRVNAVLKGTISNDVIPVSLCHGMRVENNGSITVSRADTFVNPDTAAYKILFLTEENVTGYYTPTCVAIQLTAQTTRGSWESATFSVQSAIADLKEGFQLGTGNTLAGTAICSELMIQPSGVASK